MKSSFLKIHLPTPLKISQLPLVSIPRMLLATTACIASVSFAGRPPSKDHSSFYDYLTSKDFDCSTSAKRVLKPGLISKDYDFESAIPACLVTLTCRPAKDVEAKNFSAGVFCKAEKGICEEPIDCARRILRKEEANVFGSRVLEVTKNGVSAKNKFNDLCWETSGVKDKRGTVQILNDRKVEEEACLTVYVCKTRPTPTIATCATVSEDIVVDNKTASRTACPQLNDCINSDISLPGHTQKELDEMSAEQRERVLREYEEGVEKSTSAVSQVPSTLPRQVLSSSSTDTAPVHSPKK